MTIFPFGLTTIQCTAIAAFNNTAECQQTVQICDCDVPTTHCAASASANLPLNAASGAVTWTVQSGDNVALASTICSPSSGCTFLVDFTPVICTATDTSHTSASCQCNAIMYDIHHVSNLSIAELRSVRPIGQLHVNDAIRGKRLSAYAAFGYNPKYIVIGQY
jgi:hypothetical protein